MNFDIKNNLLIKGDNLKVMKKLLPCYEGKVKLIYIDPPYNTGNDGFKYNDAFNHSTWLVFMKNRLEVARQLLADDGSIYVNIDYNEVHYLKVLMDEVFGIKYFQREIIWRIGWLSGYKTIANNYIRNHDTILFYSKTDNFIFNKIYNGKDNFADRFNNKSKKDIIEKLLELNIDKRKSEEFVDFISTIGLPDKYPLEDTWNCSIYDKLNSIAVVSFSGEKVSKMVGSQEIKGQKSEALLERIIQIATKEGDLVLDFFAGSGTTPAVAHKMGRRWIAIEQMDYIETITKVRLEKVLEGEQGGVSKNHNWQGGGGFEYINLTNEGL
jgi:adenine-specific DNA-methyltransferase